MELLPCAAVTFAARHPPATDMPVGLLTQPGKGMLHMICLHNIQIICNRLDRYAREGVSEPGTDRTQLAVHGQRTGGRDGAGPVDTACGSI